MPALLIRNIQELDSLPPVSTFVDPHTTFSVGDTHGNPISLTRYLYEGKAIHLEREQYDALLRIYKEADEVGIEQQHFIEFRNILHAAFLNTPELPNGVRFRFFGDMLADRGVCDAFTFIVLDELRKRHVNLKLVILMSNHDKAFLSEYLSGRLMNDEQRIAPECRPVPSLETLKNAIVDGLISKDELTSMIQTAYLPFLQLVDYKINSENSVDVMSHAPLTLDVIENAMRVLLPVQEHKNIYGSIKDLIAVISALNDLFKPIASQDGSLKFNDVIYQALTEKSRPGTFLYGFIWPRLDQLKEIDPALFSHQKYHIQFRHGHDGDIGETQINGIKYIGYNNIFGKSTQQLIQQIQIGGMMSASIAWGITEDDVVAAAAEVTADTAELLADDKPESPKQRHDEAASIISDTSAQPASSAPLPKIQESAALTSDVAAVGGEELAPATATPKVEEVITKPIAEKTTSTLEDALTTGGLEKPARSMPSTPAFSTIAVPTRSLQHTASSAAATSGFFSSAPKRMISVSEELVIFKTLVLAFLNPYIGQKGSYTGTQRGDALYTEVGLARNRLRALFGAPKVDVPKVDIAKEIKESALKLKNNSSLHDDLLSFGKSLEMHIANLEKANSLILVKAINTIIEITKRSYVNMLRLTQEQDPTLAMNP